MKSEAIETILTRYPAISLTEMDGVRLLNRVDTKYITSFSMLPELLKRLQSDYFALEVNDLRINAYRTMYLDTSDRAMYLDHHNGRSTRKKVRIRAYVDAQAVFLEVKNKNNKGRINKKRMELPEIKAYRQPAAEAFLETYAHYSPDALIPQLENSFSRITLVNRNKTERLTIDANLVFYSPAGQMKKEYDDLVIIELKQTGHMPSYAKSVLSDLRIRPMNISKYCLGTILTAPDVKSNRFKEKVVQLNKIKSKQYGLV